MVSLLARIALFLSAATAVGSFSTEAPPAKKAWFPVRPADALPTEYDSVVRGAFVRHVVVETEEMADLGLKTYLKGGSDSGVAKSTDPFGDLAKDLSACEKSKEERGKVGWVDNPSYHRAKSSDEGGNKLNEAVMGLLPADIISDIFASRPKGGDVLKLSSAETGMFHLIRVDDIQIDYQEDSSSMSRRRQPQDGSTFFNQATGANKVIKSRAKLKGSGFLPVSPKISLDGSTNADIAAKTYHIATTGCQMNVADSERLAGVLENNLRLEEANTSSDADVVILNTCTIREHAAQKVYDALGPVAARKRRGEPVAIVVAGCVAQQEGEALLRRVPEVDLVMGPQYTARLGDLLEGVSRGHQIVATDPSLITEDLSKPVRDHTTRAWVNIIYGCNEHCTYCVVPGVRGVEQSRSMEAILEETLELAASGYKE